LAGYVDCVLTIEQANDVDLIVNLCDLHGVLVDVREFPNGISGQRMGLIGRGREDRYEAGLGDGFIEQLQRFGRTRGEPRAPGREHHRNFLQRKNQLPSMHGQREYVEAGGLMSYGPNAVAAYRQAAFFVDKILKGTKPADLPVEQPTKFELMINLRTAKALGLTTPPSLLLRADQVIQ
jgi:hypothetical protein